MKQFYLHNGIEQQGPFDLEELASKNLTLKTSIWYEGLPEWTTAENIDELKSLFKTKVPPPFEAQQASPPPIEKQHYPIETSTEKKALPKQTVLILILIVIAIAGGGFLLRSNTNPTSEVTSSTDTYEEKVMTVEEIERSQPTDFLTADGNYNENFWGDKIKVHGVIKSTATIATYKDVVVEITYYSKTNSVIGSERYVVYDYVLPNSEKKFELKISNYKGTNTIGWEVAGATAN